MTSSIPAEWLVPQKLANGWKFECSTNLRDLVATNQADLFFRQVVILLERDYHLENFHFKIQHHRKNSNQMEVYIFCGDDHIKQQAESVAICSSCDVTHQLSQTTLLSEQKHTYAWLDFRNRSKLILTPKRHVERLSELNDEEMSAFWADTVEVIDRECDHINELNYPTLAINHGTFRKHAHMHLKIDIPKHVWEAIIVPRYRERLEYLTQLLKQTALISDCFTEKHLQKEIQKGVIGNLTDVE
jgi:diadenosine tetraphosphate (Ap4A) HIT family hydrolase